MLTQSSQLLAHASFLPDWIAFSQNLGNVSRVQNHILEKILKDHPYLKNKNEFNREPINDFGSLSTKLQSKEMKVIRHQPTSGSGDKEKLIPYTQGFIRELNQGLNPWLFDTCKTHPGILNGKHYWSISWLPTQWRNKGWHLDDFEFLPPWKRSLAQTLMAVPHEVSTAATLSSSQFATLAWLISCRDLTFLSVWSPTFLIELFKLIETWKEPLEKTLLSGKWAIFREELLHLKAPKNLAQAKLLAKNDLTKFWPKLKLISSWDSSSSEGWAKALHAQFPGTSFQGKGLWATEGVVTIPYEGQFLLSYQSHYYEFLDLRSGLILKAHELKEGQEVHPLLTTSNGFTRYQLKDRLMVTDFKKSVPALQFIERDDTYDMVGEKLDTKTFLHIHDVLKEKCPQLTWVCAFALNLKPHTPSYCFVFQGEGDTLRATHLISEILHQHFHYHLALELRQLSPEKVIILKDAYTLYESYQMKRGMVQGNIKVELATKVDDSEKGRIFHSLFPVAQ